MSDVINKRTERPCMHTFESQADRVIIETEGLDGYWLYATILKTLNDEEKKNRMHLTNLSFMQVPDDGK